MAANPRKDRHGSKAGPPRARCGVREAMVSIRRLRAELAGRGVSLSTILEEGETLRQLAHADHRR